MYGPLVDVYLKYPKTSKFYLAARWIFYRVLLGKSTCTKLPLMPCERHRPSLSYSLVHDGLSLGEIEAIAADGQTYKMGD